MLSILVAATALSTSTPVEASSQIPANMQCRIVMLGYSRSSDVKICRTRKAWADYDACHSATRYCSKARKAELARKRGDAFAMNADSRVVCRLVKGTGSRLSTDKVCLPEREWQRWWDEASAATHDFQDKSTRSTAVE